MVKKKKRCRRLTKEEKKAVWSKPESNAGAGWQARDKQRQQHRNQNYERITTARVDEEIV